MKKIVLFSIISLFIPTLRAQLVINEISQGPASAKEYVEFLVTGNPSCSNSHTSIGNWIFDDNCGFFATGSGTGIATGHLRFRNVLPFTNIRFGSLILIYNSSDPNILVPPHDYFDSNNDCIYIFPDTCYLFERGNLPTNSTGILSYSGSSYFNTQNWSAVSLANNGDAAQTVSPSNLSAPFHAVCWGNNTTNPPIYFNGSATGKVFAMLNNSNNDPFLSANWDSLLVSNPGSETPGAPNNIENANWINSMKNNCQNFSPVYLNFQQSICQGDSIYLQNAWRFTAGIYYDTLVASIGCDTFITSQLSILPNSSSTLSVSVCQGTPYTFNGNLLSSPGTYRDTLTSSNGCDSIITLNFSFKPTSAAAFTQSICQGDTFVFNNQNLTSAGTFYDTLLAANGCDSIITLTLQIRQNSNFSFQQQICSGESYLFNGQNISASGVYLDTLTNALGCDSFITLNLTVRPIFRDTIFTGICPGSSYNFFGTIITTSGEFKDTLNTIWGCDSIFVLYLSVGNSFNTIQNQSICNGQSFSFNGQNLTSAGIYYDTLTAAAGCDSIIQLNLLVNQPTSSSVNAQICNGQSFAFFGNNYSTSGNYQHTLPNATGCDSTITLNLIVLNPSYSNISATICANETFNFNNQNLTQAGMYNDTLMAANNCDSIITLTLSVTPLPVINLTPVRCFGQTFNFNGNSYSQSGNYTSTINNPTGCDTIANIQLTILPENTNTIPLNPCFGETLNINGQNVTQTGIYSQTFSAANGCDSIVNYDIVFQNQIQSLTEIEVCEGNLWNGNLLTNDTTFSNTYLSASGCDSIAETRIYIVPLPEVDAGDNVSIEPGSSVTLNVSGPNPIWSTGQSTASILVNPTETTTYFVTVTNAQNCSNSDSVTVTLLEEEIIAFSAPNAFSPNGDGNNDEFTILTNQDTKVRSLKIFNRWGELVFDGDELNKNWDGSFKGSLQPIGAYVYIAIVQTIRGNKVQHIQGSVTLIR